jgi:putative ABC transport system permease protein
VGDRFSINDTEVEVVGTYRGSKSFFWEPVVYTTYTRALALAPPERRLLNYVQVKCKPGADVHDVAERLQAATGLAVRTNEQFEKVTSDYILKETGILVNFGLAVALGFIVGALVSAQMMYNFTLDNLRFYAALKAMGAGNGRLIGMVLVQVFTIAFLGYGLGVGAGSVLGRMVGDAGLAFRMPWQIPAFAAVAILGCCLIAGLFSIQRVLRLEPGIVFR